MLYDAPALLATVPQGRRPTRNPVTGLKEVLEPLADCEMWNETKGLDPIEAAETGEATESNGPDVTTCSGNLPSDLVLGFPLTLATGANSAGAFMEDFAPPRAKHTAS